MYKVDKSVKHSCPATIRYPQITLTLYELEGSSSFSDFVAACYCIA